MKTPIVSGWVIAGLQIVIGILGLVAQWLQAGNFAPYSIVLLVCGALTIVLTYLTQNAAVKLGWNWRKK